MFVTGPVGLFGWLRNGMPRASLQGFGSPLQSNLASFPLLRCLGGWVEWKVGRGEGVEICVWFGRAVCGLGLGSLSVVEGLGRLGVGSSA